MSCYASKNLMDWTFRNQVIKLADPENFGAGLGARTAQGLLQRQDEKFVMYMHIDDRAG